MTGSGRAGVAAAVMVLVLATTLRSQDVWTVPPDAAAVRSPLPETPAVLDRGARVFAAACRKCHGPRGKGNGPRSDPDHPAADLTDDSRPPDPDGVLFYKVWNGRRPMPAFKTELGRDDVWAVVAFVKTLRGR